MAPLPHGIPLPKIIVTVAIPVHPDRLKSLTHLGNRKVATGLQDAQKPLFTTKKRVTTWNLRWQLQGGFRQESF